MSTAADVQALPSQRTGVARWLLLAMLGTVLLATSGCGLLSRSKAQPPLGDAAPPNTATTAVALAPPDQEPVAGLHDLDDGCRELAAGPWTEVPHGPDPRGALREGRIGGVEGEKPDEVLEFPTLDHYRDENTLASPGSLRAAWAELHYGGATSATWRQGHEHETVTIVQFGSPAEAQQALTAHLTELCPKADTTFRLPAGNGVRIVRDSGSGRTLYVLGDIEVSVYICSCRYDGGAGEGEMDDWVTAIDEGLAVAPAPEDV